MDVPQEQEGNEPTLEEAVQGILADLPKPVRDFVTGPERARVALELTNKYQLHADQAGEFERSYIHMLLGIKSPDEFVADLRSAGIPEASITGLTQDVNEMVFKPLRMQEQEPPKPSVVEQEVRTMQADVAKVEQPAQIPPTYNPPQPPPQYQPVAQQQTYWVPVSITAVPQPYMTTEPPPQYQPPQPPPPPPIPEPPAPRPEPVQQEAPPPPPAPMPEPRAWEPPPPPPNLPTASDTRPPLTKEYGADPYREPI